MFKRLFGFKNRKALVVVDPQVGVVTEETLGVARSIASLIDKGEYKVSAATQFINAPGSLTYKLGIRGMQDGDSIKILGMIEDRINLSVTKEGRFAPDRDLADALNALNVKSVDVVGFNTQAVILSTASKLKMSGFDVKVLTQYCGFALGMHPQDDEMKEMKMVLGDENVK